MGSIANELITRGWKQGRIDGTDGSVCILGAAGCAYLNDPLAGYDLAEKLPGVLCALQLAIGLDCAPNDDVEVYRWNDAPDRTEDEVLRVAKHADEILGE